MSKLINKARFAMSFGSDAHQTRVLSGNGKTTSSVRWNAAIKGDKQHLDILVKDKDPEVRAAVACNGHPEHLARLIKDKDPDVRKKVAMHGSDEHIAKLLHDDDAGVRNAAADRHDRLQSFREYSATQSKNK